jgi:heptosyltransferase-2
MVMAQSLFITLKQRYPDSEIDVVAPAWSVPLLKRMPEVARAIELPVGHQQLGLNIRYKIGKSLRDRHYDQAIVTPRSFKSALIPFFSKAKTRTGYLGEMRFGLLNDIRPLDKSILKQTVQRYVALGLSRSSALPPAIPLPKLSVDQGNQQTLIEKLKLNLEQPIVGFMPGAEYGPAKQWPVQYFRQLAEMLAQANITVWVFGSEKEVHLGKLIANNNNQVINLCGRTSLTDVVDLLALTNDCVTNDSGLMHIACATARHVVALYGSSDPGYTPPLSDHAAIVYKNLACSPCFKRDCPYGHTDCLNTILPEDVYTRLSLT